MIPNAAVKRADSEGVCNLWAHPKMKEADAIRALSVALGEHLGAHLVLGQKVGSALVWWMDHPTTAQELRGKMEQVKEKMRAIYKEQGLAKAVVFTSVEVRVKHMPLPPRGKEAEEDRAEGSFQNMATDPSIRAIFEQIRMQIKKQKERA